jgi:hypothetical protein
MRDVIIGFLMIGRLTILLPFDLFIREGDELTTLECDIPGYHVRFYTPAHIADRPKPTDVIFASTFCLESARAAAFTEALQVDGRRTAQVNVLVMDFMKPEFDRRAPESASSEQANTRDPSPELAFGIANTILAKIRVYSRAFQITPLDFGQDPWRIQYLTDDGQELQAKKRGNTC